MKKKLYFTIEKEVDSTGESLTGNKTITVYEMINNAPKQFCSIDSTNDADSKKEIQNYLHDNGFGDDEFEFILL